MTLSPVVKALTHSFVMGFGNTFFASIGGYSVLAATGSVQSQVVETMSVKAILLGSLAAGGTASWNRFKTWPDQPGSQEKAGP